MIGELLWLAAGAVVAGVATGILGGGAIIVPVLYEAFRDLTRDRASSGSNLEEGR
jgi:uncharacterized membrane protein YfcA